VKIGIQALPIILVLVNDGHDVILKLKATWNNIKFSSRKKDSNKISQIFL